MVVFPKIQGGPLGSARACIQGVPGCQDHETAHILYRIISAYTEPPQVHSWTLNHLQMTCETWHSVNAKHMAAATVPLGMMIRSVLVRFLLLLFFSNLTQARII